MAEGRELYFLGSAQLPIATASLIGESVPVALSARQIDPRDQTWGEDDPAYRVYFWDSNSACDEWELEGCDVEAALRWAQDSAAGRTFTLYATVSDAPRELGLIRLSGTDPTRA